MSIPSRTSFLLREFFILVIPPADNDVGEYRGYSEGGRTVSGRKKTFILLPREKVDRDRRSHQPSRAG